MRGVFFDEEHARAAARRLMVDGAPPTTTPLVLPTALRRLERDL